MSYIRFTMDFDTESGILYDPECDDIACDNDEVLTTLEERTISYIYKQLSNINLCDKEYEEYMARNVVDNLSDFDRDVMKPILEV